MHKLTFSGHESFTCRQLWLKKGYDFLRQDKNFSDPDAVVYLGVGKNMVSSIHYWMKSFGLVDENGDLRTLANYLLADDGHDPYLERPGTLWLLHYLLVTNGRASLYEILFNDFRREHIQFNKPQLAKFIERCCIDQDLTVSPKTLQRDIDVMVRSYLPPNRKSKALEDDFTTLLLDLDMLSEVELSKIEGGVHYMIERRERAEIPPQIVLYAILAQYTSDSISFRELANGNKSPGMVFALNDNGLLNKINEITAQYPSIVFTDDAGVRELQLRDRPDPNQVLDDYYGT